MKLSDVNNSNHEWFLKSRQQYAIVIDDFRLEYDGQVFAVFANRVAAESFLSYMKEHDGFKMKIMKVDSLV